TSVSRIDSVSIAWVYKAAKGVCISGAGGIAGTNSGEGRSALRRSEVNELKRLPLLWERAARSASAIARGGIVGKRRQSVGNEEIAFAHEQKQNAHEEIAFPDEQKRNAREQIAFPDEQKRNAHKQIAFPDEQKRNAHEQIAFPDEQKRNAREQIAFAHEQKRNAHEQIAFPDEQKRNAREQIAFPDEQKRNAHKQIAFPDEQSEMLARKSLFLIADVGPRKNRAMACSGEGKTKLKPGPKQLVAHPIRRISRALRVGADVVHF